MPSSFTPTSKTRYAPLSKRCLASWAKHWVARLESAMASKSCRLRSTPCCCAGRGAAGKLARVRWLMLADGSSERKGAFRDESAIDGNTLACSTFNFDKRGGRAKRPMRVPG
mgnify:CR=1 FL=1